MSMATSTKSVSFFKYGTKNNSKLKLVTYESE